MWNDVIARQMVAAVSLDRLVRGETERRSRQVADRRAAARAEARRSARPTRAAEPAPREVVCLRAAARAGA